MGHTHDRSSLAKFEADPSKGFTGKGSTVEHLCEEGKKLFWLSFSAAVCDDKERSFDLALFESIKLRSASSVVRVQVQLYMIRRPDFAVCGGFVSSLSWLAFVGSVSLLSLAATGRRTAQSDR